MASNRFCVSFIAAIGTAFSVIFNICVEPFAFAWALSFPPPAHPVGWGSAFIAERAVFEPLRARTRTFRQRIAERVQAKPGALLFGGFVPGASFAIA